MTGPSTWRTFAKHYENQKPTSPPEERSAKTRSAPSTAFRDEATARRQSGALHGAVPHALHREHRSQRRRHRPSYDAKSRSLIGRFAPYSWVA